MSNANNKQVAVAVEVEVRPGQWVAGNRYRSIKEARLGLDGVCNWRVLIEA